MPFGGALSLGIGAGSSLLSGLFGSKGANKAGQIISNAAGQVSQLDLQKANDAIQGIWAATQGGQNALANATSNGLYNISGGTQNATGTLSDAQQRMLALFQPYIDQTSGAVNSLQQLAGSGGPLSQQFSFTDKDLTGDPGYQFTLSEGQKALQRSAAAQGNLFSSGTLKSLAGYTTGTANQYFNDAYNRAANTFNINRQGTLAQIGTLQGLANLGFGATSGASGALGSTASQIANTQYQGGLANANFGLQGNSLSANLGLAGAAQAGNFGLQGAQLAGNAILGGANAQAGALIGGTNAWLNALNGGTNATLQYLAGRGTGGGVGGGSGAGGGYTDPGWEW